MTSVLAGQRSGLHAEVDEQWEEDGDDDDKVETDLDANEYPSAVLLDYLERLIDGEALHRPSPLRRRG